MSRLWVPLLFLLLAVSSAWSQITVTSPANNSSVNPPVWIRASVSSCNGAPSTSFGYSVDDSSSITWGTANDIDTTDSSIGAGTHIIHFKAWSNNGQCGATSSTVTVYASGITVTSPTDNSSVNSPVWIRAHVSNCYNAPTTSFGYSVDNSTTFIAGKTVNDIDTMDSSIPAGTHVIHYKAWSNNGQCPAVNRTVTVTSPDGITIQTPAEGATTTLPVAIQASVASCNGSASTSFGYSVDNSTSMNWGSATSINTQDSSISVGTHVLHFKAWSNNGECPTINRDITVNSSGAITVNSPAEGASVNSPVWINASVTSCNGAPSTSFGYSVDDSTDMTWGTATNIDTQDASIQPGAHVIHFKAWSNNGQCPAMSRDITVNSTSGGLIPPGAVSTTNIEQNPNYDATPNKQRNHPAQNNWGWEQDPGVASSSTRGCSDNQWLGDSAQTCAVDSSSTLGNGTRSFAYNWKQTAGPWTGERWHISAATPSGSYNYFVYDTYITIPDPTVLWAIEMDTNVTVNGKTFLFGVECDYGDNGGRWMITNASGWVDSGAECRADTELPAGSHHVQMKYHIANMNGSNPELIYDEVVIDDGKYTESFSEKSGDGPRSLGWGDGILLNFQLDNNGSTAPSGSTTLQLQHLTLWEWNQ